MASDAFLDKMQHRQNYQNFWYSDLTQTMSNDFGFCMFSACCPPCVSYMLRKRALYDDMTRYQCCAGYCPCSGKLGESHCPEVCLCTEVFLCFGNSVAGTRFLLQDEFNIQTTKCDNCIIGFMFCINQLACICSLIACLVGSDELRQAANILQCLADMVYCTVCACMQTQHKLEMDKRDGKLSPRPMDVPPTQQMSRLDQQAPPPVGYPAQPPVYAQQAYGYPPPPPPPGVNSYGPPPGVSSYGPPPGVNSYGPPPGVNSYGPPPGYPTR